MKNYDLVIGDLLESDAQYVCHQCNALTSRSAHLSKAVFTRFPWADIYTPRSAFAPAELPLEGQRPGDIVIRGNGEDQRLVINIIGQLHPGPWGKPDDGLFLRQKFFDKALQKIAALEGLQSLAFPFKIGCGAAKGDWVGFYEPRLDDFAEEMAARSVKVFVYRLPGEE